MGAIGGVDAALLPTHQDPSPMAGSAVSCRPHPRQEPSALARTLGSVRRGAGQPALLPRRIRHPQPGMPRPGPGPRARQGWLRSNGRSRNPCRQSAPDRPGAAESRAEQYPGSAAPRHPPRRLTAAGRANAVGMRPGLGRGSLPMAEDRRQPRNSCETGPQPLIHGARGRIPRRAPGPETSRRVQNPVFWQRQYNFPFNQLLGYSQRRASGGFRVRGAGAGSRARQARRETRGKWRPART